MPTVGCAIGMLVGGLLGGATGALMGSEPTVIALYAGGAIAGAVLGSIAGYRWQARHESLGQAPDHERS